MNEMVERLAKTIYANNYGPDGTEVFDEEPWRAAVPAAEAVIEMLREPTEGMKDCGIDAGWFFDTYGTSDRGREAARTLWRNMVAKAFEE